MGSNTHKLLLTFLVLFSGTVFYNITLAYGVRTLDGGWSPISPSDPAMVDIAKFAVNAYNKEHLDKLVFDSLVGGQTTPHPSPTYNMTIAAKGDDHIVRKYFAQVADRPYMNSLWLLIWEGPI